MGVMRMASVTLMADVYTNAILASHLFCFYKYMYSNRWTVIGKVHDGNILL